MPYTISQCANMIEARVQFNFFTAGQSQWSQASSMWFLDHTQTYYTRQDSPERVTGESQRPIPDNTQHSQETDIHAHSWIRTRNPSNRTTTGLRLRPRGHRDWRLVIYVTVLALNFSHKLLPREYMWCFVVKVGKADRVSGCIKIINNTSSWNICSLMYNSRFYIYRKFTQQCRFIKIKSFLVNVCSL